MNLLDALKSKNRFPALESAAGPSFADMHIFYFLFIYFFGGA
jgi:hypothetical protein